uniref:Uncharacterized protein n=1 Tax=Human herpesvirus 2 TaxID=10310 RepID=A0A481TUC5_HHV2|nr:hypothetical protein [Human alphaherpesvirus 2]
MSDRATGRVRGAGRPTPRAKLAHVATPACQFARAVPGPTRGPLCVELRHAPSPRVVWRDVSSCGFWGGRGGRRYHLGLPLAVSFPPPAIQRIKVALTHTLVRRVVFTGFL